MTRRDADAPVISAFDENLDLEAAAALVVKLFCPREIEVFRLWYEHGTIKSVATVMDCHLKTVAGYRQRIANKLGIYSSSSIAILSWRLRHHLDFALAHREELRKLG